MSYCPNATFLTGQYIKFVFSILRHRISPLCVVDGGHFDIQNIFRMAHKTLLAPVLIAIVGMLITDSAAVDAEPRRKEIIDDGYIAANVSDPAVKDIVAFATAALSKNQKSGQLKLIQIVKAEKQVVAGRNFKLTLKLATVSPYYPKSLICQVVVFEQSWTKTLKVTQSICN